MKVLIVYHFYAHYREPVLRELVANGTHQYTVVSGDLPNHEGLNPLTELVLSGGRTVEFVTLKNVWFRGSILWQKGLLGMMAREEFDAVILLGNLNFLSSWFAALIARIRGKRVLMWTHGLYGSEQSIVRMVRCTFYRLANALLLYGHHAQGILEKHGFSPDRLQVIYNSLNVPQQEQLYQAIQSSAKPNPLNGFFCQCGLASSFVYWAPNTAETTKYAGLSCREVG